MVKKQDNTGLWIIIAIIAIIIISQNLEIKSTIPTDDIVTTTTDPYITTTTLESLNCDLQIIPTSAIKGTDYTMTFHGEPNTECNLFGQYGILPWTNIGSFSTDNLGYAIAVETTDVEGTFKFEVRCGYCTSNTVYVDVLPICVDSDGGTEPDIYGEVTTPSGTTSDYCLDSWTLIEYDCAGDFGVGTSMSCDPDEECINGYCRNYDADSDGDGWSDSDEEWYGSSPTDANDTPASDWSGGSCTDLCDYLNPGNYGFCGTLTDSEPWNCIDVIDFGWYASTSSADSWCNANTANEKCCCYGM